MFKSRRFVFIIILSLLNSPHIFNGQPLISRNKVILNRTLDSVENDDKISLSMKNYNLLMSQEDSPIMEVTRNFVGLSIFLSVIGTILLSFILRFLGSVPLAKHSIILYLYKDITIVSLLICYINSLSLIACFVNGNGYSVNDWHAKIISYCFSQLCLYVMCTINVVILLKLLALKENVLDPAMPWEMSDEMVIKIWRGVFFVLINVFMMTTYFLSYYPLLYYFLIADSRIDDSVSELPFGSKIIPSAFLVLCILNTVMGIISKIYKNHDIRTFSSESASFAIIGDLVFIPLFFVVSMGSCLILVFHNSAGHSVFWVQCILSQLCVGIVAPLMTIARSSHLQSRVLFEAQELIRRLRSLWNSFDVSALIQGLKQRSPRIYPIQE